MKIISFNVNGVRAVVKKTFVEDMNALNADVICLQETKANDAQVAEALQALSNTYSIFSCSAERPGYSGTSVLSKIQPLNVSYGLGIAEHDTEGRVITCEYNEFYLINTYVPNSGSELARLDYRETWDDALLNYMLELEKKKPVILCGDLNVAHQPIDLANPKSNYNKSAGYTQREIDGLSKFIAAGFKDTFRHFHPEVIKYSWWSARFNSRAKNVGWRIDYFLASERVLSKMNEAFILNDVMGSDHCPVGIDLKL